MELKNQQPPLGVDEQIANLKALGLQVNDENYAKSVLNDISYFRLIKAYGLGLKNKNSAYDGTITFAFVYDDELPECMEDWVFRLEITGNPAENEDFSEKVSEVLALPADEEHMRQLAEKFGEKHIDKCVYVGFESAIPQISDVCFESMENIYAVNDIARRYSELSREDAAKFKAVLEHELWRGYNGHFKRIFV